MVEEESLNWSNLPRSLINTIYSNLNLFDLLESRFINKHWSKCCNSWVFSEIDVFENKKEIIRKYCNSISKVSNYHLEENIINSIANNCSNLKSVTWVLPSNMDSLIKILNDCKNITKISLMYSEPEEVEKDKLNIVLSSILKLKVLNHIEIEAYEDILLNLFLQLLPSSPSSLDLSSYPDSKTDIIFKLRSMTNLKKVSWYILYPLRLSEEPDRASILTPSDLIIHKNIEHVSVRVSRYKDSQGPMANYLVDSILNLFNNPNFYNLKSLEWHISNLNIDYLSIFSIDLPQLSNKFTNLTLINLMVMDKFLLSFIINQCPNLEDLRFVSPLILPHKAEELSSLNRLKKLLSVGFENGIEAGSGQIQRLFPNVRTLNMHYITERLHESIMQASPIPQLFPKANIVIIASHGYNLTHLIDNITNGHTVCNWEVLYIVLHSYNKELLDPLLRLLRNLKQLYMFAYNEFDYPETINTSANVYKVGHLDYSAFSFDIIEKIQ